MRDNREFAGRIFCSFACVKIFCVCDSGGGSLFKGRMAAPGVVDEKEDENKGLEVEVYLNLYDLHRWNSYVHWMGFGAYHSGVEVLGKEFGFGYHDFEQLTGIYFHEPREAVGAVFRESILIGSVAMAPDQLAHILDSLKPKFYGTDYHMLNKNCNHFTHSFVRALGLRPPGFINRLATVGSCCACCLPTKYMQPVIGGVASPVSSSLNTSYRSSGSQFDTQPLISGHHGQYGALHEVTEPRPA